MSSLMTPQQTLFRTVSGGRWRAGGLTHGCDRLQVMTEDLTNMLAYDGRKGTSGVEVFSLFMLLLNFALPPSQLVNSFVLETLSVLSYMNCVCRSGVLLLLFNG